jgi:predicted aldo/keto reductase-like oxidoreductase
MAERYLGESTCKLGFGFMRVPMKDGKMDYEQTCQMVDKFQEAGGTLYHTAWAYEGNEEFLGETLVKRYPRESFQIADNLPVHVIRDFNQIEPMFQESLDRLGVDYIDYFLLHMLRLQLSDICEETGAWKFISDMKAAGKVKHIGFSFHDAPQQLDTILTRHPEVDFVQLQINYADWDTEMPNSKECYEIAWKKHKKPVMIMEPVKGGILAADVPAFNEPFQKVHPDWSNSSWALRYVLGLDGLISAFSGMSSLAQMEDNLKTLKDFKPLNEVEMAAIQQATENLRSIERYECTSCRYCVPLCPQKIRINDMIDCINDVVTFNQPGKGKHHYDFITGHEIKGGKPGTCIECGECEDHCPQHLPIIELMHKAQDMFEDMVIDQA